MRALPLDLERLASLTLALAAGQPLEETAS